MTTTPKPTAADLNRAVAKAREWSGLSFGREHRNVAAVLLRFSESFDAIRKLFETATLDTPEQCDAFIAEVNDLLPKFGPDWEPRKHS